jgi:HSP20 family protein
MTQMIVENSRNNQNQTERKPPILELTPAIDIYESEKELLLVADLPCVSPDALTVEVNHPDLKIEGRVPAEGRNPERVYSRMFRLDSTVDVTKIEAKLNDGVLKVHLPKSEPYRVRKIQVKGS